jgi:hypothetical protein
VAKNKEPYPLLRVTWLDHYSRNGGWTTVKRFQPRAFLATTVGYVVAEDDDYLVLAGEIDHHGDTAGNDTAILKRCILKCDRPVSWKPVEVNLEGEENGET